MSSEFYYSGTLSFSLTNTISLTARSCIVLFKELHASTFVYVYDSCAKECPWAEHLTGLPKRRVSACLCVY